jgi:ABC-type uncharacterized transport system ATPase subunit
MSVGERQRVEIIRALLQNPRLLIMDEPTSVLAPQAVQKLFGTLRQLAKEGCSILYISHKLDEIRELCMARMIAPKSIRMTPKRYQMRNGTTATATIMSVRLRNSR